MIVPMSKITLLGLNSQKEALLQRLMRSGCVEVTDISDVSGFLSEEDRQIFRQEKGGGILYAEMRDQSQNALEILQEYVPEPKRKGLLPQKRQVEERLFSAELMTEQSAKGTADMICRLGQKMNRLQNEKNQLENRLESLRPWEKLPFALDRKGTRTTKIYTGTLLKTVSLEAWQQDLEELELVSFDILSENSEYYYGYLLFHRSVEKALQELLQKYSFQPVRFEEQKGTYPEVTGEMKQQRKHLEKQMRTVLEELEEKAERREQLQLLYDYLSYRIDREDAAEHLFSTENMFVLDGYLPSERAETLKKELEAQFTVSAAVRRADPETEQVPTMLRNNKLVEPYESITQMYSTPNYQEIDPNAIMAPFYFLFFGMMVSDVGYGLLTALVCFYLVRKYKPEGMMGNMLTMIGFGGISTMFWGILFGGYFGDTISVVTNGAFNIPPLLFDPLEDPMTLLMISFGLGIAHIFVGIGAKVYLCFQRKVYAEGIAHFSWILIIGGLVGLLAGSLLGAESAGAIGKWVAVAGVIALILTNGWEEKILFQKLFKGISGLTDVTGYFSDILSYSRLLALGLSTGVIAMVVNIMGSLGGRSWYGWILFAAVFAVGHTLNLAINLLGAYVHTSRLQYVEFFGKFFEGGGRAFFPLRIRTKYVMLHESDTES